MPLAGNAPVTANTFSVTQQAQGYFNDTVAALQGIANGVIESRIHLVQTAVQSDSGNQWALAVDQWSEQFADVIKDLQDMSEMLGVTLQVILQNEGKNSDLVSQLVQQTLAANPATAPLSNPGSLPSTLP